jgi:uroporphyrinogen decarboxylase
MGIDVQFPEGGPQLSPTVRSAADVARLPGADCVGELGYVAEALRGLRAELGDRHALLGFSGAPFTLASYLVEGKGTKTFEGIKALMYQQPEVFAALLDKLADAVIAYLAMQLDAGADAVQLFDSWAGELRLDEYRRWVLPSLQRIAAAVQARGGRLIVFVRHPGHLLDAAFEVPCDAYGLDQRVDLAVAAQRARALGRSVQGNLDPIELFASPDHIARRVGEMAAATGGQGWIANLGHGVVPATPIGGVEAFVAAVQELA